ncbi:MAG TPA: alpha/beta fold hydrolase [Vicinamibacterales bacterium]
MRSSHFIRGCGFAAAIALSPGVRAQQQPIVPATTPAGTSSFTIFVRGAPLGAEQVSVARTADGWTISSTGRLAAPLDIVGRRLQVRYTPDWRPIEFTFDGTIKGQPHIVHTVVEGTAATTDITIAGQSSQKRDTIDPNAVLVMPNSFFASYEAVAVRLRSAGAGSSIPAQIVGGPAFAIRTGDTTDDRIETATRLLETKRTHITLMLPGTPLEADMWTDDASRMLRFSIPAQSVEVVREDIASVAARRVPISRPNDEQVRIPSNGFTLAGTISKPAQAAPSALPAVVLVSGSGPNDRDEQVAGIPVLGQLASAIADAGFMVLRYDKRGVGQSGGRAESAGLQDYVEDLRGAVKLLSERKDVDAKRIAIVGHSEGGLVAMLAAAKEKKVAGVVLLATPGISVGDLILAQQAHLLARSKLSDAEKQDRIAMQKKIQQAVTSGKGLDQLPAAVRKQVDNMEFQTLLAADPAKIVPDVRQPILIVQGELDTQVEPSNADRLVELANKRKNAPPAQAVKVPGVNHLLVPATTGELDEYATLPDKHVSPAVSNAVVAWLQKTLGVPSK